MNKIIAVDFDGTCVTHDYPRIGQDVPHAARILKRLKESDVKIIVWTLRCGKHLDEDAREWFESKGIDVWSYNLNPEQSSWSDSPKCYAHIYIDDAALGCPLIYPEDGSRPYVDWQEVEGLLEERGFLPVEK